MTAKKDLKSRKLANSMKDGLAVNEHGVITPSDDLIDSFFEKEGLSIDELKKYQKAEAKAVPALALAGGEIANDYFKEHPDAEEVSMAVSFGHDTHTHQFKRTVEEGQSHHKLDIKKTGAGDQGELHKVRGYLDNLFE